jgi:hypothetical protein
MIIIYKFILILIPFWMQIWFLTQRWALVLAILIPCAVSQLSMLLNFELYCICRYLKRSESFLCSPVLDATHIPTLVLSFFLWRNKTTTVWIINGMRRKFGCFRAKRFVCWLLEVGLLRDAASGSSKPNEESGGRRSLLHHRPALPTGSDALLRI